MFNTKILQLWLQHLILEDAAGRTQSAQSSAIQKDPVTGVQAQFTISTCNTKIIAYGFKSTKAE